MYLETQYSLRQLSTDLFIIHIYLFLTVKVFVIKNLYYKQQYIEVASAIHFLMPFHTLFTCQIQCGDIYNSQCAQAISMPHHSICLTHDKFGASQKFCFTYLMTFSTFPLLSGIILGNP